MVSICLAVSIHGSFLADLEASLSCFVQNRHGRRDQDHPHYRRRSVTKRHVDLASDYRTDDSGQCLNRLAASLNSSLFTGGDGLGEHPAERWPKD